MTPGDLDTGERLLTSDEAAAAASILLQSWFVAVGRGSAPPADGHIGRTPIWKESTVAAWLEQRRTA